MGISAKPKPSTRLGTMTLDINGSIPFNDTDSISHDGAIVNFIKKFENVPSDFQLQDSVGDLNVEIADSFLYLEITALDFPIPDGTGETWGLDLTFAYSFEEIGSEANTLNREDLSGILKVLSGKFLTPDPAKSIVIYDVNLRDYLINTLEIPENVVDDEPLNGFTWETEEFPDLTFFKDNNWDDNIIVSNQTGTNTSSSQITTNDTIYLDWVMTNQGEAHISTPIKSRILLDGVELAITSSDTPLLVNQTRLTEDYNIGSLSAGTHTIKIELDYSNEIEESNETNNSYSRTFTVVDATPPTTNLLDSPIYRFQNIELPGTYLFAGEEEAFSIIDNFPEFELEGFAFYVANQPDDNLVRFNRFRNEDVPGTYLYATEGESASIRANFSNVFAEEGIAFYAYSASANQGTDYYRFHNTSVPGTYLFVNAEERQSIINNFPQFVEEGIAFEVAT